MYKKYNLYFMALILFFFASFTYAATEAQAIPSSTTAPQRAAVLKFAEKAALTAFTYDYTNYEQHLKQLATFFNQSGWESYKSALKDSGNIQGVIQHQLTVKAQLTGTSKIVQHTQKNKQKEWIVEVPIQASYTDPSNRVLTQKLIIKLDTVGSTTQNLAIARFVARPDMK